MGFITRITTFVANTKAVASEVNGEFDNIVAAFNGQIDNDNIAATPRIEQTKVEDISNDDAAARTDATPGTSASPAKPVDLSGEVQRLRYRVKENAVGRAAFFTDAAGVDVACGWQELPIRGENRLANPSFEIDSTGAGVAPDGWDLVGTPATLTTQTTAVSEGTGNDVRIVADAAGNSGISQTFTDLKADAYYLFGCRLKATGTAHITSAGGLAAGNDYQDFDLTTVSGTYSTVAGVVQATNGPAQITFSIFAEAIGDDIKADHAFLYELGEDPIGDDRETEFPLPVRTPDVAFTIIGSGAGASTYLSTALTTPSNVLSEIEVTGWLSLYLAGGDPEAIAIDLQVDIDGGGPNRVAGPLQPPSAGRSNAVPFHYINPSPGLGEVHTFQIEINNTSGANLLINGITLGVWESALTGAVRKSMIRKATAEDRQAFSILWAEFLRDAHKAGSDILPTPRNLEVSLRIFDRYIDGYLSGAVYIAEGIGVTMIGESESPQTFDSAYGRIATAWGTYVREGHRGEGWSRRLREKAIRWAGRYGFDVATGPIAFSNEASLESCKKLGIETPAVVGVRYLKGVHDGD